MKLLLISNSTMSGQPYLDYPKYEIQKFLGEKPVIALFIPYAAVTFSFDEYCEKVEERFAEVGHHIVGIHTFTDPMKAVEDAEAIVVGGGNTWQLVRMMHDRKLMNPTCVQPTTCPLLIRTDLSALVWYRSRLTRTTSMPTHRDMQAKPASNASKNSLR